VVGLLGGEGSVIEYFVEYLCVGKDIYDRDLPFFRDVRIVSSLAVSISKNENLIGKVVMVPDPAPILLSKFRPPHWRR
jgi:hypothetical protein